MDVVQSKFIECAKTKCLPYLLSQPLISRHSENIAFIVVGSVATGLCTERSDIDIALICDDEIFSQISQNTNWDLGRPTEIIIEGIQFHYYAITVKQIEKKLKSLDDEYLYVYSYTLLLKDVSDIYFSRIVPLAAQANAIRKQRVEGKLDLLIRRVAALQSCMCEKDIFILSKLCLELIAYILKTAALLDNVPFDPRKRLFQTALSGKFGVTIEEKIRGLFNDIGSLSYMMTDDDFTNFAFPPKLKELIEIISHEARIQGFRVGLDTPDRKHLE